MVRGKCLEIMPCINIWADGNNQAREQGNQGSLRNPPFNVHTSGH